MIGLPKGRVNLSEYTDEYQKAFSREKSLLEQIFEANDYDTIEHIGSTAVPDTVARPIIDILITLPNIAIIKKYLRKLLITGYNIVQNNTFADTLYFEKGNDDNITATLYVTKIKSQGANDIKAFKRYLLTNASAVSEYNNIKKKDIQKMAEKEGKYNKRKVAYIKKTLVAAKKEFVFDKKIRFQK